MLQHNYLKISVLTYNKSFTRRGCLIILPDPYLLRYLSVMAIIL